MTKFRGVIGFERESFYDSSRVSDMHLRMIYFDDGSDAGEVSFGDDVEELFCGTAEEAKAFFDKAQSWQEMFYAIVRAQVGSLIEKDLKALRENGGPDLTT